MERNHTRMHEKGAIPLHAKLAALRLSQKGREGQVYSKVSAAAALRRNGHRIKELKIRNRMGSAWTADYLKVTGELHVDFRTNIAAEAWPANARHGNLSSFG